jgi:hypothetical protein
LRLHQLLRQSSRTLLRLHLSQSEQLDPFVSRVQLLLQWRKLPLHLPAGREYCPRGRHFHRRRSAPRSFW